MYLETVFGCPLEKLCQKEGTTVPLFVKLCVEEVERRGTYRALYSYVRFIAGFPHSLKKTCTAYPRT